MNYIDALNQGLKTKSELYEEAKQFLAEHADLSEFKYCENNEYKIGVSVFKSDGVKAGYVRYYDIDTSLAIFSIHKRSDDSVYPSLNVNSRCIEGDYEYDDYETEESAKDIQSRYGIAKGCVRKTVERMIGKRNDKYDMTDFFNFEPEFFNEDEIDEHVKNCMAETNFVKIQTDNARMFVVPVSGRECRIMLQLSLSDIGYDDFGDVCSNISVITLFFNAETEDQKQAT